MNFFHIGIRVDKILKIGPSTDPKFPTCYTLNDGVTCLSSGDWKDNANAVNAKLCEIEASRNAQPEPVSNVQLEERKWNLLNDIAMLDRELAHAREEVAAFPEVSGEPVTSLILGIQSFLDSGKQYPTKATKDQWARLIEQAKEAIGG